MQDSAQASLEIDQDCGQSLPDSFANYDPDMCLWKTLQLCLDGDYQLFSETWPRSGMMQNGSAYRQPPLVRRIGAIESSLWPTPVAHDDGKTPTAHMAMKARMKGGPRNTITNLTVMAKAIERGEYRHLWPTPKSSPSGPDYARMNRQNSGGDDLTTAVARMWPTPMARDHKSGKVSSKTLNSNSRPLNEVAAQDQVSGQLNPAWVEWLMGFPIGWTDLED